MQNQRNGPKGTKCCPSSRLILLGAIAEDTDIWKWAREDIDYPRWNIILKWICTSTLNTTNSKDLNQVSSIKFKTTGTK